MSESIPAEVPIPPPPPAEQRAYRRRLRNVIIHKPMQREFSLMLIGLLMISISVVAYVIHGTIREVSGGGGYQFGRISPYEVMSDLNYLLLIKVSSILLVTLVIIGLYGVFFLHRVAGPVYRFRQVLLRINDGEIPREIKLREGDFFTETAVEINRLIKRLESEKDRNVKMRDKINHVIYSNNVNEPAIKVAKELKALLDRDAHIY